MKSTKDLTIRERLKIREAIQEKNIPDEDVWLLLMRLFEENERNRKSAIDLAWRIEEMESYKSLETRVQEEFPRVSAPGLLQGCLCFIERQGDAEEFLKYFRNQMKMLDSLCGDDIIHLEKEEA